MVKKKSFLKKKGHFWEKCVLFLFFSLTTTLYLHNLTRDIYSGDLGDLVTAAYVAGVPHPPGYPLFTFLGFLLTRLPLPLPPVSKVGLICVFSSLVALFFFYKLSYKATKHFLISLLSTSILAFSYLFWFFTEIPEVFALNNLFAVVIFYLAVLFHQEKKPKHLYLLVFFLSLALAHHQTILFIFPSIALLILPHLKLIFSSKIRVMLLTLIAILGFLPYAYVPIAASKNPVINWGDASTLNNLINLILRNDYGGFAPNPFPPGTTIAQIYVKLIFVRHYFLFVLSTLTPPVIFFSLLGMLSMVKKDKLLFYSYLLAFFLTGPVFTFYGSNVITNVDSFGVIQKFHTLSSVIFLFFLPYGLLIIKRFFDYIFILLFSKTVYANLAILLLFVIPLIFIIDNFARTDLSKTQIGNNLAADILSPLPKNSVLFVHADTITFNIWYAHYVLNIRPDVRIVNLPGLESDLYSSRELQKYLTRQPRRKLSKNKTEIVLEVKDDTPAFSTYEVNLGDNNLTLIPRGLTLQVISKKAIPQKEKYIQETEQALGQLQIPRRQTLAPSEQNSLAPEIPTHYSNALLRIGNFISVNYKDLKQASLYYQNAVLVDNQNYAAYTNLAISLYKTTSDCKNSIENAKLAVTLYPIKKAHHSLLYILHKECKSDQKVINEIAKKYSDLFNEDIDIEVKNQEEMFKL